MKYGTVNMTVTNDQAVWRMVEGLRDIDKNRVIKIGLRVGILWIMARGRERLRQRMKKRKGVTGNLLKSMRVKVKKIKPGALAGFKYPEGSHAHLLDKGTKDRYHKSGKWVGKVKPMRYWSETKENDIQPAVNEVLRGIGLAMDKLTSRSR